MPANVTLNRPAVTDNDSLNAAAFNAITVDTATVPDASSLTEGVIRLAGDLAGSAAAPALAASGAAAGTYGAAAKKVPQVTVDAKGRVTSIADRTLDAADVPAHTHLKAEITDLGDAAGKNTGTAAGTVAAGDDSRITGAAQKASNLSDLDDAATARTNLGLGSMATRAVTISTSAPSGGADGDVWLQYT